MKKIIVKIIESVFRVKIMNRHEYTYLTDRVLDMSRIVRPTMMRAVGNGNYLGVSVTLSASELSKHYHIENSLWEDIGAECLNITQKLEQKEQDQDDEN